MQVNSEPKIYTEKIKEKKNDNNKPTQQQNIQTYTKGNESYMNIIEEEKNMYIKKKA